MQCTGRKIRLRIETEMIEGDQESTHREVYVFGTGNKLSIFISHMKCSALVYCDI